MRLRLIPLLILIALLSGTAAYTQDDSEETVSNCPGAPPMRLIVGARGLVLPGQSADLHVEAVLDSEIFETIPENTIFEVLEGPVCAENFAWWHIRYGDEEGWMIEGEYDRYHVEPLTPITTENFDQLQLTQLLGRGVFTGSLDWSSNGEKVALISTVGILWFDVKHFDAPPVWYRPTPESNICGLEYSNDGSDRFGFAICTESPNSQGSTFSTEIRTIDETPGEYAERWYQYDGAVQAMKFISGSSDLIIASENLVVQTLPGSENFVPWKADNLIHALDVSADGSAFAATDGRKVVLGMPSSPTLIKLLDVEGMEVTSLALNPDGSLLALGVDQQIQLWDVKTRTLLSTHDNLSDGSPAKALDMKFSLKNQRLVTTTDASTLTVWEVGDSDIEQVDTLDLEGYLPMTQLALNPEGTQAALIAPDGKNNTLFLRDMDPNGHVAAFIHGHTDAVSIIAFSPDSQTVISTGDDHSVRAWNVLTGSEKVLANGRNPGVSFGQDGTLLAATASLDGSDSWWLQQWDAPLGAANMMQQRSFFIDASGYVFSPDNRWLAAVIHTADTYSIAIWQVSRLRESQISEPTQPDFALPLSSARSSMVFSPDGRWFAYTDLDGPLNGIVKLLDTTAFTPVQTLKSHTNPIWNLAFSPDSKLLVSVSGTEGRGGVYLTPDEDSSTRIWDVETGAEKFAIPQVASVNSAAFSPDGKILVTGSANGDLDFWDPETGDHQLFRKTPYGAVNCLAFSPDGVWLAASSGTVVNLYRIPAPVAYGEG